MELFKAIYIRGSMVVMECEKENPIVENKC